MSEEEDKQCEKTVYLYYVYSNLLINQSSSPLELLPSPSSPCIIPPVAFRLLAAGPASACLRLPDSALSSASLLQSQ